MNMVFYSSDNRRRPMPPMYAQRGGPPNQMRNPGEPFFYPNDMRRPPEANFYPNAMRLHPDNYFYPTEMNRPFENYFYPEEMRRMEGNYYYPGEMRGQGQHYFYPEEMRRQVVGNYYPNQMGGQIPPQNAQPQPSMLARLPDHINTFMGHMGTVQNGVNMIRQLGSLLGSFRR